MTNGQSTKIFEINNDTKRFLVFEFKKHQEIQIYRLNKRNKDRSQEVQFN